MHFNIRFIARSIGLLLANRPYAARLRELHMQWYYMKDGQQTGPFDDKAFNV
ncbi:MAG: hypothetical protein ACI9X0_001258, partial [Kiritimatiellia bacterium]